MRKTLAILQLLICLCCFFSCRGTSDPYAVMSDIISAYGAEGIIYSPTVAEGESGYIDAALFRRIYAFEGSTPRSYAIFLNSHADYGAECGVFVTSDAAEAETVLSLCRERVKLLDPREECGTVIRRGDVIFYSTLRDTERAEELFLSAIGR